MKILVCPLNWGLGHATRCVPLIRQLLNEGHEPVLVSDGFPLEFLRQEFPALRTIVLPSYSIQYAAGKSQIGAMMLSLPAIIRGIIQEHRWLKEISKTEHFDGVISDNRFGMWNKNIHSVYITHQLMIKMPGGLKILEPIAWLIHRAFICCYDECRIPDVKENGGLSGDLSHKYPLPKNAKFIGSLSRFHGINNIAPNKDYELVAVISGLEPQRSIFEQNMIERYRGTKHSTLIISGKPQPQKQELQIGNITLVSHLPSTEMASVIIGTNHIVSRSGYSTIMDLAALNCLHKAEFIPTPGQTEQEYLAFYLLNR